MSTNENRIYSHVWQSQQLGRDPEGYVRAMINGQWIEYDYAATNESEEKPTCYDHISDLTYLGYLDYDSPIDCSYRNFD